MKLQKTIQKLSTATTFILIGVATISTSNPTLAATIFNNQTDFLNNVASGFYLENFDSLPTDTEVNGPLSFSNNGFSYTATVTNGFYNASDPNGGVWLTTYFNSDPINFNFSTGNVTAIGGYFFPTNINGNLTNGQISITFNDGSTSNYSFTNPTDSSFFGVTTSNPITSLSITSDVWPTVDDLYVGTVAAPVSVPEPTSILGLLGVGALGATLKRQKKQA